jgi:poly-gamma-glutamate synthesis protein (capsule biosynthesis protein)
MSMPAELPSAHLPKQQQTVRIFLSGDVMTGRGIDQILPQPCDPILHETYATSALHYVQLAEEANGPIPRQVGASYVWGAALDELNWTRPDARVINYRRGVKVSTYAVWWIRQSIASASLFT